MFLSATLNGHECQSGLLVESNGGQHYAMTAVQQYGDRPSGSGGHERLRAQAMEALDFGTVRQRVAGYARFHLARRRALDLSPAYTSEEVNALQAETSEGLAFLAHGADVSLHAEDDPTPLVERAALEGVLPGTDILTVAESVEVLERARSAFRATEESTPGLSRMAKDVPDLSVICRRVEACIGPRGEVLDKATPSLGQIRRQIRDAYGRVAGALERFIGSPVGQEALQDNVVSMRGDRLVLQVKRGLRHRVPGIVHDASNTGATLYVEPLETVELGNQWRELSLEEEREVARVLRELSALIGAARDDIMLGMELTARLDLVLARARFSASLGETADLAFDTPAPIVNLVAARHPMLGRDAVPVSVRIEADTSVLVITGPNTGGKTVAMKTVGLLALMRQSGLRAPAAPGSSLPLFNAVYADVGDHQSIHQSVSTFGSHMRSVVDILHHADSGSLVLLDELGTSTDPEEGSALAKAILNRLAAMGVTSVVTTHHRSIAAHAQASPSMANASVDLDPCSLLPTYHLTLGAPGRSYAMSVATHLGLPDDIMEEARSLLEPRHMLFEDWMKELQAEREELKVRLEEADRARAQAETARMQVEAVRSEVEARLAELDLRREEALREIDRELSQEFDSVRKQIRRAEASLSWQVSDETVRRAASEVAEARKAVRESLPDLQRRQPAPAPSRIRAGDVVEVKGLNVRGRVVAAPEDDEEAEVAIGGVRFKLDPQRLTPVAAEEEEPAPAPGVAYALGPMLTTAELHVRGMRVEEALFRVEEFLDKAVRDGMSSVRIVHGKGTGVLRQAVRELLSGHPLARSHAPEAPERGGDGATTVSLL